MQPRRPEGILGCIKRRVARRSKEVILSFTAASRDTTCSAASSSMGPSTKRLGPIKSRSTGATKMVKGLEHLSCEARLRRLGLLSLEKALCRDLIVAFQHLKGVIKKRESNFLHRQIVIRQGETILK